MRRPLSRGVGFALLELLLLASMGCAGGRDQPPERIDLAPFEEMARTAPCADIRNRLYLIDGRLVFWDRQGRCPDNAWSRTLFGGSVERVLCEARDSIAGPMRHCREAAYGELFDAMVDALDAQDSGSSPGGAPALGAGHTVREIPF